MTSLGKLPSTKALLFFRASLESLVIKVAALHFAQFLSIPKKSFELPSPVDHVRAFNVALIPLDKLEETAAMLSGDSPPVLLFIGGHVVIGCVLQSCPTFSERLPPVFSLRTLSSCVADLFSFSRLSHVYMRPSWLPWSHFLFR